MIHAPYEHQAKEFYGHRATRSRALLWQMRTGKSKEIIDTACFLNQAAEIDGVLIVAPNGVHRNWTIRELEKHHWNFPYSRHAWRFSDPFNTDMFKMFLKYPQFKWLSINMEALIHPVGRKALRAFVRNCPNFMFVVDESHHFARPGAKRTSWARALARRASYRRILTGTSVENSPLQAFSQFELLEKEALGYAHFGDFKQRYAHYELANVGGRWFPRLANYMNLEELRDRMAPFTSVVLRSDCHDLPPVQADVRYVEMSMKQLDAWKAVKKQLVDECAALGLLDPLAGGAKLVKLQQIESGFLLTDSGPLELIPDEANPKMQALMDELQLYDGRVIVWCAFIHEIRSLMKFLTRNKFRCGEFHGQVSGKVRDEAKTLFEQGKLDVLVAQPKAGGEGYDFSTAGKIIWYSQTPDAIVRNQASERATSIGGESVQMIDLVAPNGVDDYFMDITTRKTSVAEDMSRTGMRTVLDRLQI